MFLILPTSPGPPNNLSAKFTNPAIIAEYIRVALPPDELMVSNSTPIILPKEENTRFNRLGIVFTSSFIIVPRTSLTAFVSSFLINFADLLNSSLIAFPIFPIKPFMVSKSIVMLETSMFLMVSARGLNTSKKLLNSSEAKNLDTALSALVSNLIPPIIGARGSPSPNTSCNDLNKTANNPSFLLKITFKRLADS